MNGALSWVEVDSAALLHNLRRIRELAPFSKVAAVVKANGYGHGINEVTRVLAGKVDAFAVATCAEGVQVRKQESTAPIWVLLGFGDKGELLSCVSHQLTPVISSEHQLNLWTSGNITSIKAILELDVGMGRMGFAISDSSRILRRVRSHLKPCDDIIILGHLPGAELADSAETREVFNRFINAPCSFGCSFSLANSAAILAHSFTHLDWVRPGIMLYGVSPFSGSKGADFGLRTVMKIFSRVRGIRTMGPGQPIGYGSTFRCESAMRVGLVPFGYADGFPRQNVSSSSVAIRGRRCAVLGRVSMDSLIVDLSNLPEVDVGEPVEIWGETITVEEVAAEIRTIPHQILTGLGDRVKRA